jgi:hypothetical protein
MRKKEERFYRMTGETWKLTDGEQLGVRITDTTHGIV